MCSGSPALNSINSTNQHRSVGLLLRSIRTNDFIDKVICRHFSQLPPNFLVELGLKGSPTVSDTYVVHPGLILEYAFPISVAN